MVKEIDMVKFTSIFLLEHGHIFLIRNMAKFTTSWINHNSGDVIGPIYNYKKVTLFCFWDGQTC